MNESVLVSDQHAIDSVTRPADAVPGAYPGIETPLHHARLAKLAAQSSPSAKVVLREVPLSGLLVLRADATMPGLREAVDKTLQLELPGTLQSHENGDNCIRWISPDEWWISCPVEQAFASEQSLREALFGKHLALVNTSGGNTLLRLEGECAALVLKKSTAYDISAGHFAPGKVVSTTFAKTQAVIRCVAENEFELIVRRSFADYVWLWIQGASKEYGLRIADS